MHVHVHETNNPVVCLHTLSPTDEEIPESKIFSITSFNTEILIKKFAHNKHDKKSLTLTFLRLGPILMPVTLVNIRDEIQTGDVFLILIYFVAKNMKH